MAGRCPCNGVAVAGADDCWCCRAAPRHYQLPRLSTAYSAPGRGCHQVENLAACHCEGLHPHPARAPTIALRAVLILLNYSMSCARCPGRTVLLAPYRGHAGRIMILGWLIDEVEMKRQYPEKGLHVFLPADPKFRL
jgi:hypothetical protein